MDIRPKKRKKVRIDLPIDLLGKRTDKALSGDIEKNKLVIKKTLDDFGIPVEMADVKVGPTVTQYTLKPSEGVKLSRIITLQNDLALALAAHPIRIEAPIPGKSLVGIEIPNQTTATVVLRELLETKEFKKRENNLTIAVGKDVAGQPWLADLGKLPHLLIAGATGSGKSVCLNSIIVSLLYQNSSEELKFILVAPKRVELTTYNGIPHLLTPVLTDVPKVISALKWTVGEMERRFYVLSEAGKRDIKSYNETVQVKMPYIVFAIDELADLMTAASAEVEGLIIRLAQMSRAVGIHLILATQRPSVDIITGLIKANIPARIAFSVASLIDSRTILDMSGAEKLLGRGDMLYISAELSKPKRLQGAYLSDREIEEVIRYLRERSEPDYNQEIVETNVKTGNFGRTSGVDLGSDEELYEEAKEVVMQAGKASASLLQRRLRIGYARAARLLDLLEEDGMVGPADGAKPREVMIKNEEGEEEMEMQEENEEGEKEEEEADN
ncbi:DNA translocase FtsK [Candidatus Falkowbacteria bacterium]|nr:DNA translocase FtsK [Candidatus Falkowbacteria bacterium]